MLNVINGGVHADNELEPQEFMLMPVGAASFSEALRWGVECYHTLKSILHERGLSTAVGDEGGFAPALATTAEALQLLMDAIAAAGLEPGAEMALAMDPAMSELLSDDGTYRLEGADRTADDMIAFWTGLLDRFPIVSLEDGLAQDDWEGWGTAHRRARRPGAAGRGRPVRHERRAARAGLPRGLRERDPDQAEPDRLADRDARRDPAGGVERVRRRRVARSGETEDVVIADLAVATNAGQIKTGAPSRAERTAKYNQLLRIEEELGENAATPARTRSWGPAHERAGRGGDDRRARGESLARPVERPRRGAALIALAVLLLAIAPLRGYLDERGQLADLRQQATVLERQNRALQDTIDRLSDATFLERMARECLGMVEAGRDRVRDRPGARQARSHPTAGPPHGPRGR